MFWNVLSNLTKTNIDVFVLIIKINLSLASIKISLFCVSFTVKVLLAANFNVLWYFQTRYHSDNMFGHVCVCWLASLSSTQSLLTDGRVLMCLCCSCLLVSVQTDLASRVSSVLSCFCWLDAYLGAERTVNSVSWSCDPHPDLTAGLTRAFHIYNSTRCQNRTRLMTQIACRSRVTSGHYAMIKVSFPSPSPHQLRYLSARPPVARMIDSSIAARPVTRRATRHPELQCPGRLRVTGQNRAGLSVRWMKILAVLGWWRGRCSGWRRSSSLRYCWLEVKHWHSYLYILTRLYININSKLARLWL